MAGALRGTLMGSLTGRNSLVALPDNSRQNQATSGIIRLLFAIRHAYRYRLVNFNGDDRVCLVLGYSDVYGTL